MPVHRGADSKGPFYQWGDNGKRYYYQANNKRSREIAKTKANLQGRAAYSHGYRGNK